MEIQLENEFYEVMKTSDDADKLYVQFVNSISKLNEPTRFLCMQRAILAYLERKNVDFISHLRQVMIMFGKSFEISKEILDRIDGNLGRFGIEQHIDNNKIILTVRPIMMKNNKELKSTYKFEKKSISDVSIGDGNLFKYTGHHFYKTLSQKIIVNDIRHMGINETLLAVLPTGGGKSLTWQLPAVSNECEGLIIVIVPTISLILDHLKNATELFEKYGYQGVFPKAIYSDTSLEERQLIKNEINDGVLPLLFISPESLVGDSLKSLIHAAAENGKISRIYIDEAHLILDWGSNFRPEFQLLSPFVRKIRQISPDGLNIILLSATITEDDVILIEKLFSSPLPISIVRGDRLRPEIQFYANEYKSEDSRVNDVLTLIDYCPKPAIIYCMLKENINKYYDLLIKNGYKNVEKFTGDTSSKNRENILKHWNNNKTDVIIATSAFGMGVDKSDIRTIIHTYMPESINRFYQEVGRAGRDGYSALSYWLVNKEIDQKEVRGINSHQVLKDENIIDRWNNLRSHSQSTNKSDEIWIDSKSKPSHLLKEVVGKKNANWNTSVILLMSNFGLIELVEVSKKNTEYKSYKVKLTKLDILDDKDKLSQEIERAREEYRYRIDNNLERINNMFKNRSKKCFSDNLVMEYIYPTQYCSGCQYCRSNEDMEYQNSMNHKHEIYIYNERKDIQKYIKKPMENFFRTNNEVVFDVIMNDTIKMTKIIKTLIYAGFEFFVFDYQESELTKIIEEISVISIPHVFITKDEFLNCDLSNFITNNIVMFYSRKQQFLNEGYKFLQSFKNRSSNNKVIVFVDIRVEIEGIKKPLSEIIESTIQDINFFKGE